MNDSQPLSGDEWFPIVTAFQFLATELGGFGAAANNLQSALAAGYLDSIAVNASDDDRLIMSRASWDRPELSDAGHLVWTIGNLAALGDGLAGDTSRVVFVRYRQIMDLFRVSVRREDLRHLATLGCWADASSGQHNDPLGDDARAADQAVALEPWNEMRMREAISQCAHTNREKAWREVFKPLQHEHGWKAQSFRDEWSVARGTKGHKGRLPT